MMPHDLPPWGTVWWYFRKWRDDGTWERIEAALRARVREAAGREATPSAAIIDSQSVKTTEKGDPHAGKNPDAFARSGSHHIQDRDGAKLVLVKLLGRFPLRLIWADFTGGWLLEVVRRNPDSHRFEVLPRRWVVERTLGWLPMPTVEQGLRGADGE